MHQPAAVGRHERPVYLHSDLYHNTRRERSVALHALFKGFALDELHRVEEAMAGFLAERKNAGYVGVAQLRGVSGLASKALARLRVR